MLQKLRSIKWKLITLYLVLLVAILVTTGCFLQNSLKSYFGHWLERNMIKEMNLIVGVVKPDIQNRRLDILNRQIKDFGDNLGTRITIIGTEGQVLADSKRDPLKMENHLYRPEVQEVLTGAVGKEVRYSSTLDTDMKYVALAIEDKGQIIGIIRSSLTLDKLNQLYQGIWIVLLRAGFIAILISVVLSLKLINQITNPIREMTTVAQKIANGFLDQQLVVRTKDEIGQLARMFNHMVKRLKKKMQEISSEKNKVEAIVTSIGDVVIAVDEAGRIILFNIAAQRIFGTNEEGVLGGSIIQVTKNYRLAQLVEDALDNEEIATEEIEILLPEERTFRAQVAPIAGDNQGAVAVLRDITDIRRLEKMRKEFVGNVSHELKTPLTSIKGYVETLLAGEHDSDTYQNFLSIINDEADRLEKLIEDLLNLSKIESNFDYFTEEDVDLIGIINNASLLLESKAGKKNIELNFDLPYEFPIIKGNREQLSRVMINLIDNAIKYTDKNGKIEIRVYQSESEDYLVVEVEDNGMGIPKKDLPRIFERFYRVDKARSRKLGGTGLGLSIVKHIIEQHQGEIGVESEAEKGSKFYFKLPIG